ncbi:hypothetical protein TSOC_010063 [Tetrabaena socialis]|uniref:Uncharacterized protein n=1 Tax=Tetrabaena socialis TaxID=47790 RepID=A0A2J7ZU89_9CHLO|nr:hypothetical protein TSOC_010063 [Tetrabaena socialis]|eukprot:PNH03841.1 hypothetical protein TSOC_010063 [Tetrabaena socialis]
MLAPSAAPLLATLLASRGAPASSACAPALRAAACAWNTACADGAAAHFACGRREPEEPASSSMAPPPPRASTSASSLALLARHQHRQLPLTPLDIGARGTPAPPRPWPSTGFRTFASAAQPQAPEPQQQAGGAEPAPGSSQASTPTPTPAQDGGGGGPQARVRPPRDVVYLGPLSQQHKLLKAMEVRQRRAAAEREAELQGLKIVAVAAAMRYGSGPLAMYGLA